ncbi:MAG: ribonuclease HII, partial [Pseudomonadota bacterium]|nr:ribonuclease HII [Pseudomonadota bacterium]
MRHEQTLARRVGGLVCGVDEAGRGPWAGPLTAAAVILDPDNMPSGINDSKRLTALQREKLHDEIMSSAQVAVAQVEVAEIDRVNILQASMRAMAMAVSRLPCAPAAALIDGNRCPTLSCRAQALVGGDGQSLSIAAASIIAKVTRDRLMRALH